jgi:hypothetical protein
MSYYQRHYHLSLSRVYLDMCDSDTTYVPCVRFALNQGLAAVRTAFHCLCTNVNCIFWHIYISYFTAKFRLWRRIYDCVYSDFRLCCWQVRDGGIPNFETWVHNGRVCDCTYNTTWSRGVKRKNYRWNCLCLMKVYSEIYTHGTHML